MKKLAVIGYDNVFSGGTLTASGDPEGGEKENAVDGFTYDFWSPTGAGPHTLAVDTGSSPGLPCDYLAIHNHNLDEIGGTITLQGGDDGENWTDVIGAKSPSDGGAWLWQADAQKTYRQWRIYVTGTDPSIAVVQAGVLTTLDSGIYVGVDPPTLNRKNEIMNQTSEGGQFLGRSRIRQGVMFKLELKHLSTDWVRNTWDAFAEYAEENSFFFSWRQSVYPGDCMFCWTTDDASATQDTVSHMKVSVPLVGQL